MRLMCACLIWLFKLGLHKVTKDFKFDDHIVNFCKGVIATEQAVKTSSATKTQANASATLSNQPLDGSVTSVSPATGTSPTASSANATGTPTPATHRPVSATTVGMQLWATSVTNVSSATTEDQR